MTDLVEFIEARLADDLALALLASPGPWHLNAEHDEVVAVDDVSVAEVFALSSNQLRNTAAFIASHDPARVLREVEAKRELLGLHGHVAPDGHDSSGYRFRCSHCDQTAPCASLRLLALPYADHPDYRSEWSPP